MLSTPARGSARASRRPRRCCSRTARIRRAEGALQLAALHGNTETLAAPARPRRRDQRARRARHDAADVGRADGPRRCGRAPPRARRGSGPRRVVQSVDRTDASRLRRSGPSAAIVKALLDATRAPSVVDDEGATALDWALRRGDPDIIQQLAAHETAPRPRPRAPATRHSSRRRHRPREAVVRAIPLLEQARPAWRRVAGCPSCHHDALPAFALEHALHHGLAIDTDARTREAAATAAFFRAAARQVSRGRRLCRCRRVRVPARRARRERLSRRRHHGRDGALPRAPPGRRWPDPRDDAARARRRQRRRAHRDRDPRALDIRTESVADRPRACVPRAALPRRRPRIASISCSACTGPARRAPSSHHSPRSSSRPSATTAASHSSSGLRSDAYATGQAIVALREAAALPPNDPAIQRAVKFLLAHQYKDGSWFVATRALRFQPFIVRRLPARPLAVLVDRRHCVGGDGADERAIGAL